MKSFLLASRLQPRLVFWLAAMILAFPAPAMSQIPEAKVQQVQRAMVRVVANGHASSGFVYGPDYRQVITALHAVLPQTQDITISCRGVETDAEVVRVLRKADLVLLQASKNLKEFGCATLEDVSFDKPPLGAELTAFGFRPDNSLSAFSQPLKKGSGDPETLYGLVPDAARNKIVELAMPDANLPLYYVNGSVFPGFSGGPVFDKGGNLVGVVQGGLDKGLGSHAWLIPAVNIQSLLNPAQGDSLPDINPSEFGFSAPAASNTKDSYIEFSDRGVKYQWVKTKTRSFDELYQTADPALGLDTLLDNILPEVETYAEHSLTFDIYEEMNHGLIIAVPEGQALKLDQDEYYWALVAEGEDSDTLIAVPATLTVDHALEGSTYQDSNGREVHPSDDGYFAAYVAHLKQMWAKTGRTMTLDSGLWNDIRYENGNKILRLGYTLESPDSDYIGYYYESLLVKGEEVLQVEADLDVSADSEVTRCLQEGTADVCGDPYWRQVSFMLAGQLSSFASLGANADRILATESTEYSAADDYDVSVHDDESDGDDFDGTVAAEWVVQESDNGCYVQKELAAESWIQFAYDETWMMWVIAIFDQDVGDIETGKLYPVVFQLDDSPDLVYSYEGSGDSWGDLPGIRVYFDSDAFVLGLAQRHQLSVYKDQEWVMDADLAGSFAAVQGLNACQENRGFG